MATESQYIFDESFIAASDLSAKQFLAVKFSADNTVDSVSNIRDVAIGILQNKPKAGEAATVRLLGMSKAVSNGSGTAIAAGDGVGTDAGGKMIKKATAAYGVLGVAVGASSADGAIISVLLPAFGYTTYVARLDA